MSGFRPADAGAAGSRAGRAGRVVRREPERDVPKDAELVGIWWLHGEVGAIEEAAFYKRIGDTAFLWVVQGYGLCVHYGARLAGSMTATRRVRTLVLHAPAEWPDHYQALCLVDRLFRTRAASVTIGRWGRGCLLGWQDFAELGWFTPSEEFLARVLGAPGKKDTLPGRPSE